MWSGVRVLALSAFITGLAAAQCPPVETGKLYRLIEQGGGSECATPMTQDEIQRELHDPFWTGVLSQGSWPDSVDSIDAAILKNLPGWSVASFVVGEGSQIPTSIVNRDGNRDLRYVLGWSAPGKDPTIFLSARPPQVQGGTTQTAMEVISFDAQKGIYNYYQFINNEKNYYPPPSTWTWSGDSHSAWQTPSAANGCFKCHINGGLNMKELTAPWNNWNATSPGVTINPDNVPEGLAAAPLFSGRGSGNELEIIFKGAQTEIMHRLVGASIQGSSINHVPRLLERLIQNSTTNFGSSQIRKSSSGNVNLSKDFYLYDSVFRDVLGLSYPFPSQLAFNGQVYSDYIAEKQFRLVNCNNGTPKYQEPGATFFAGFTPLRPFEDQVAIQNMLSSKIISDQFAAAVLMVDFQNPVFSQVRGKLMTYANQIQTASLVPSDHDIPTQFAALVHASGASACPDPSHIQSCTPEQQFLYYYDADWKTRAQDRIKQYLNSVQARVNPSGKGPGVADYLELMVSRGFQFANWNPICNLDEKDLLLPCTSLGPVWKQMNTDGTLSGQDSYQCSAPPPDPCSCSLPGRHQR